MSERGTSYYIQENVWLYLLAVFLSPFSVLLTAILERNQLFYKNFYLQF